MTRHKFSTNPRFVELDDLVREPGSEEHPNMPTEYVPLRSSEFSAQLKTFTNVWEHDFLFTGIQPPKFPLLPEWGFERNDYSEPPQFFCFMNMVAHASIQRKDWNGRCDKCSGTFTLPDDDGPLSCQINRCGHLLCNACTYAWLVPIEEDQWRDCSVCARPIKEMVYDMDTLTFLNQTNQINDYIIHHWPSAITEETLAYVRKTKVRIFCERQKLVKKEFQETASLVYSLNNVSMMKNIHPELRDRLLARAYELWSRAKLNRYMRAWLEWRCSDMKDPEPEFPPKLSAAVRLQMNYRQNNDSDGLNDFFSPESMGPELWWTSIESEVSAGNNEDPEEFTDEQRQNANLVFDGDVLRRERERDVEIADEGPYEFTSMFVDDDGNDIP